jgi:hypothetical protein
VEFPLFKSLIGAHLGSGAAIKLFLVDRIRSWRDLYNSNFPGGAYHVISQRNSKQTFFLQHRYRMREIASV